MIVVSQDRKTIVNFENVCTMYAGESHKGEPHIYVETSDGECTPIGKYDAGRAKEVLAGIVHEYESFIIRGALLDEHGRMAQGEFIPPKVYTMPEV